MSFLDHHLRCGDSLFGGKVSDIAKELGKLKGSLLQQSDIQQVSIAKNNIELISNLTDIDIAEAHHSKSLMETVNAGLMPL